MELFYVQDALRADEKASLLPDLSLGGFHQGLCALYPATRCNPEVVCARFGMTDQKKTAFVFDECAG